MRKYRLFPMIFAVVVFFGISSCHKEKDDHLERWMIANNAAFNAIKSNPDYKELVSPGNEGSIYYKTLHAGDGTDSIRYTSSVACYYKGTFVADYPERDITKGYVFEHQLFDDGPPAYFSVSGMISGWKTALQHMTKGDKWEIWIPYQLGYGREGSSKSIPGFATLVFEIEIVNVSDY